MNKIVYIPIILTILMLVGCSNEIVENRVENEKIIPAGLVNEMGDGEIIITTPISTSKDTETPVIYIDEYKGLSQIGFQANGFDESRPTYIYIDKKLNTIEDLSKSNTVTLTIYEDHLNEGTHKIEVVQFDNNNIDGTPITYKTCNYKINIRNN